MSSTLRMRVGMIMRKDEQNRCLSTLLSTTFGAMDSPFQSTCSVASRDALHSSTFGHRFGAILGGKTLINYTWTERIGKVAMNT